jgi:hypothetical protein
MPFLHRGLEVEVDGRKGRVVGGNSQLNIQVRFPGERYSGNYHPTRQTTYYKGGGVIADYKRSVKETSHQAERPSQTHQQTEAIATSHENTGAVKGLPLVKDSL